MARRTSDSADDARLFGSVGPSTLALSAFGTSGLVPLLLIAIIAGSVWGIVACLVAILLVVWLTLRALGRGYRLDGSVLTVRGASTSSAHPPIDLAHVERTARQRRDSLVLKVADPSTVIGDDGETTLDLRLISMDSAARLRSVMVNEFGIDCSTWAVTGSERVRRDAR